MEKFLNKIKEEKNFFQTNNNEIKLVQTYIVNVLFNDYTLSYIFYIYFTTIKTNLSDKNIIKLIIIINCLYLYIDIISNLNHFSDKDLTYNKPSVHIVFDETVTTLGLLYFSNSVIKCLINILENTNIKEGKKFEVITFCLKNFNCKNNFLDDSIKNNEIQSLFRDDTKVTKPIINKIKNKRKVNFIKAFVELIFIISGSEKLSENILEDHYKMINSILKKEKNFNDLENFLKNKNDYIKIQ